MWDIGYYVSRVDYVRSFHGYSKIIFNASAAAKQLREEPKTLGSVET